MFIQNDGVPNVVVREFTPKTGGVLNSYWKNAKFLTEMATDAYAKNLAEFGEDIWMNPVQWKSFDDVEFGAARWITE